MELTELDKAIIITIFRRGGKSKKAHFPVEFICKGFPSHLHDLIKRRILKLRRNGYLSIKPHPSGPSFGLTDEGWNVAKELEQE